MTTPEEIFESVRVDWVLNPIDYYRFQLYMLGWKKLLFKLTDTHYPYFLALGIYYPKQRKAVVCKVGRWELRRAHEMGHHAGLKHTMRRGYIMHPWGLLRGWKR